MASDLATNNVALEIIRLRNEVKCREREIERLTKENSIVQNAYGGKERQLEKCELEARKLKEKLEKAEGEVMALGKEVAVARVDKKKLELAIQELKRANEKHEADKMNPATKVVKDDKQLMALNAELRAQKTLAQTLTEQVRVLEGHVRDREKQLLVYQAQVEAAAEQAGMMKDLENTVAYYRQQLEDALADIKILQGENKRANVMGEMAKHSLEEIKQFKDRYMMAVNALQLVEISEPKPSSGVPRVASTAESTAGPGTVDEGLRSRSNSGMLSGQPSGPMPNTKALKSIRTSTCYTPIAPSGASGSHLLAAPKAASATGPQAVSGSPKTRVSTPSSAKASAVGQRVSRGRSAGGSSGSNSTPTSSNGVVVGKRSSAAMGTSPSGKPMTNLTGESSVVSSALPGVIQEVKEAPASPRLRNPKAGDLGTPGKTSYNTQVKPSGKPVLVNSEAYSSSETGLAQYKRAFSGTASTSAPASPRAGGSLSRAASSKTETPATPNALQKEWKVAGVSGKGGSGATSGYALKLGSRKSSWASGVSVGMTAMEADTSVVASGAPAEAGAVAAEAVGNTDAPEQLDDVETSKAPAERLDLAVTAADWVSSAAAEGAQAAANTVDEAVSAAAAAKRSSSGRLSLSDAGGLGLMAASDLMQQLSAKVERSRSGRDVCSST